jgi:hypothetical protein
METCYDEASEILDAKRAATILQRHHLSSGRWELAHLLLATLLHGPQPVSHIERSAEARLDCQQAKPMQRCLLDRSFLLVIIGLSCICTSRVRTMWHSFCSSLF